MAAITTHTNKIYCNDLKNNNNIQNPESHERN